MNISESCFSEIEDTWRETFRDEIVEKAALSLGRKPTRPAILKWLAALPPVWQRDNGALNQLVFEKLNF